VTYTFFAFLDKQYVHDLYTFLHKKKINFLLNSFFQFL